MNTNERIAVELNDFIMDMAAWMKKSFLKASSENGPFCFTLPQYKTLLMIKKQQPCKMSDISLVTKVSQASLTIMIDKLVEDGVVDRVYSKEDRRVVLITLTEAGERCLDIIQKEVTKALSDAIAQLEVEERSIVEKSMAYMRRVFI